MKIKIGDRVFKVVDEPIMVILNTEDREHICGMDPTATKYARFPEGWGDEKAMREWMADPEK